MHPLNFFLEKLEDTKEAKEVNLTQSNVSPSPTTPPPSPSRSSVEYDSELIGIATSDINYQTDRGKCLNKTLDYAILKKNSF